MEEELLNVSAALIEYDETYDLQYYSRHGYDTTTSYAT